MAACPLEGLVRSVASISEAREIRTPISMYLTLEERLFSMVAHQNLYSISETIYFSD